MKMSRGNTIDAEYLKKEYHDAANLNARIQLHQRFSLNPYGWLRWVFDQFELSPKSRILELGCGPGSLWLENLDRIPEGWDILLTDFSPGMLQQTQENLAGKRAFQYKVVDAQHRPLPFEDDAFDAVIANHMLYYISDKPSLFSEIRRILQPGGRFFASTVGVRHLFELVGLITRFDSHLADWGQSTNPFTLENGAVMIAEYFPDVSLKRYDDRLAVNEVEPLLAYLLSSKLDIEEERIPQLKKFLEDEMDKCGGVVRITKDSGIFLSRKV
jgi:ubiquinone/menaquinone biosynthesis C-methylase UbiE